VVNFSFLKLRRSLGLVDGTRREVNDLEAFSLLAIAGGVSNLASTMLESIFASLGVVSMGRVDRAVRVVVKVHGIIRVVATIGHIVRLNAAVSGSGVAVMSLVQDAFVAAGITVGLLNFADATGGGNTAGARNIAGTRSRLQGLADGSHEADVTHPSSWLLDTDSAGNRAVINLK
jgi:hypothetical protein